MPPPPRSESRNRAWSFRYCLPPLPPSPPSPPVPAPNSVSPTPWPPCPPVAAPAGEVAVDRRAFDHRAARVVDAAAVAGPAAVAAGRSIGEMAKTRDAVASDAAVAAIAGEVFADRRLDDQEVAVVVDPAAAAALSAATPGAFERAVDALGGVACPVFGQQRVIERERAVIEDPASFADGVGGVDIRWGRGVGRPPAGDLDADQLQPAAAFDFEDPAVGTRVDHGLTGRAFVGADDRHVAGDDELCRGRRVGVGRQVDRRRAAVEAAAGASAVAGVDRFDRLAQSAGPAAVAGRGDGHRGARRDAGRERRDQGDPQGRGASAERTRTSVSPQ